MERKILRTHPSVMFVYSPKREGEVILSGYDGGYPRIIYSSKPNLLGGNPKLSERNKGPYDVLKREVEEEINFRDKNVDWKGRPINWANIEDIKLIQEGILNNIKPYDDVFIQAKDITRIFKWMPEEKNPVILLKADTIYPSIHSVFGAEVSQEVFECVKYNINAGRRFFTEGFVGIYNPRQLEMAGEFSTAHATAPILNYFLDSKIPYPEEIRLSRLNNGVRELYSDYDNDFEHSDKVWNAK